jgi:Outer membrane protein beta-barrel domain
MIPPISTTTIAQINSSVPVAQSRTRATPAARTASIQIAGSNWKNQAPVTSPDLKTTPKLQIAQSELPGTSPQAPPSPSIRDTGNGYPTRIPQNYVGPAIGFGNGSSAFGVISRFPFSENYSIRPSAVFGNNNTVIRVPITYDFALGDKEPFERNPLLTFHAGGGVQFSSRGGTAQGDKFGLLGTIGVDINLYDGIAIFASYNTDFADVNGTNIGLGFEF